MGPGEAGPELTKPLLLFQQLPALVGEVIAHADELGLDVPELLFNPQEPNLLSCARHRFPAVGVAGPTGQDLAPLALNAALERGVEGAGGGAFAVIGDS